MNVTGVAWPALTNFLEDEADYNLYGYVPNYGPNILFLVLFALTTIAHFGQVLYYRQWWMLVMPVGTLAEVGGYIPRFIGHDNPRKRDPYVATMALLIITPCLFAAVHFTVLGRICTLFPRKYSLVPPVMVMPFFVSVDIISIIVQGIGAGSAGSADTEDDAASGSHVTVGGVAVQLTGYIVFMLSFLIFAERVRRDPPTGIAHYKPLLMATFFSSLCIILRSIYRVIEMATGWTGSIATKEWCLFSFDASLVLIACVILNFWNPARYLPKHFSWKYNPEKDVNSPFYKGSRENPEDVEANGEGALSTSEKDKEKVPQNPEHEPEEKFIDAPLAK